MNSIRHHLTRRLLLAAFLLLGIGLSAVYVAVHSALLTDFDEALRAKMQFLCTIAEVSDGHVEIDFSDRFLRTFGQDAATDFFQLWQRDSEVIIRSPSLRDRDLPRMTGEEGAPRLWDSQLNNRPVRVVGVTFAPLTGDDKKVPATNIKLDLVVASDRGGLDRTLRILAAVLAGCGGLLLLITGMGVPRLLRRGLKPLDQLAAETSHLDATSLSRRFATEGLPDEIRQVSECLNLLLSRLGNSFERERRFSADLAHELRTPLAEIRNLAEVAIKWPESRDGNTDEEIRDAALHMESLTTRMLALARSEDGGLPLEKRRIDLVSEIRTAWDKVGPLAAGRKIRVEFRMPATQELGTDPVILRSILTNLMSNAAEHSPANGVVVIAAEFDGKRFEFSIANDAPDLDPSDAEHLFERFWRKDAARSGGEHAGLGLSLCKALAGALDWTLHATLDGNRTLTLRINGTCAD